MKSRSEEIIFFFLFSSSFCHFRQRSPSNASLVEPCGTRRQANAQGKIISFRELSTSFVPKINTFLRVISRIYPNVNSSSQISPAVKYWQIVLCFFYSTISISVLCQEKKTSNLKTMYTQIKIDRRTDWENGRKKRRESEKTNHYR